MLFIYTQKIKIFTRFFFFNICYPACFKPLIIIDKKRKKKKDFLILFQMKLDT